MQLKVKKNLSTYKRDTYTDHSTLHLESIDYLDCSLGTNPYGYSPYILQQQSPLQELLNSYPAASADFIQQILIYWQDVVNLKEDNIRLEAGTFGVIERLHKLLLDENSYVLGYGPQFSDYGQDVLVHGAKYEYVSLRPENNYQFNLLDMQDALQPKYKLVYLDNPNNPTGQIISLAEIESLVSQAQAMGIAVLVDEAYGDFMTKDNSAIRLVSKYSNLFVARSFSKGFGLAGLRVGYVVMSEELLPFYALVAHPFPVNAVGQYYAKLALKDELFLQECQENNRIQKELIKQSCTKLHILATDPKTPILTLVHPEKDIDLAALFLKHHVLTTSGQHFANLGPSAVRLRLPGTEINKLLEAIRSIEGEA